MPSSIGRNISQTDFNACRKTGRGAARWTVEADPGQLSCPSRGAIAVELLKANYASNDEASRMIPQALAHFYEQSDPTLAAGRLQDISKAGFGPGGDLRQTKVR